MDLLTVPVVDMGTEARPMTLEEMEDVGKRYRERKRQSKVPLPTGEGQSLVTGWAQVQIPPPRPLHHLPARGALGNWLPCLPLPSSINENTTYHTSFL